MANTRFWAVNISLPVRGSEYSNKLTFEPAPVGYVHIGPSMCFFFLQSST